MSKENLGHLMVDIETLGTQSGSVICSIAAVEFDIVSGATGLCFNEKITLASALGVGLKIDADTLEWWMCQSNEARNKLFGIKNIPLAHSVFEAFTKFNSFLKELGVEDLKVWGNSARFDLGILEAAYNVIRMQIPWVHWNERDLRTLVSFSPEIKKNMLFEGVKHDALADCFHQIKYCSATYRKIKGIE